MLKSLLLVLSLVVGCIEGSRAIFHVGPGKTGSSHIQAFLYDIGSDLVAANYNITDVGMGSGVFSRTDKKDGAFCIYLKSHGTEQLDEGIAVKRFFDENAAQGKNIVMSSEVCAALGLDSLRLLKKMLSPFDETVIVITYRAVLPHAISRSYQHSRFGSEGVIFSSWAYDNYDSLNIYSSMIETWASVFGQKHVAIIDYYGVEASGNDIGFTFVCEIMGVLCSKSSLFAQAAEKNENPGKDTLEKQFLEGFRLFAAANGCIYDDLLHDRFVLKSLHSIVGEVGHEPLPIKVSNLTALAEYSVLVDAEIRSKYKDNIYSGNRTANIIASYAVQNEEVDFHRLFQSPTWFKKFSALLQNVKKLNYCEH